MSAHLFCILQWMPFRQGGRVFVSKRKIHSCSPAHSLPWPVTRLVSHNLLQSSIQHTTVRSTLELFVPACPVIGLTQQWFNVVIHGMNVENSFLVSTAAEAVGVKGVCLAPSYILVNHRRECIGIIAVVVERTKHTPT